MPNNFPLVLVALGLTACGLNVAPSAPDAAPSIPWEEFEPGLSTEVVQDAQLLAHPGCDLLEAAVKERLIGVMRIGLRAHLRAALNYSGHIPYAPDSGTSWSGSGGSSGAGGGTGAGPADVTETNVQVAGALSMSDLAVRSNWYPTASIVRRSVMADDFVYAISEAGIRVAHVAALKTPLATAEF